ncbi:hypothetical protein [Pseudomonas sp.]|uniref:hypothetical protein n=1 Tax=Pseudomonas sp. TaxID=306 RepID=UPI003C70FBC8
MSGGISAIRGFDYQATVILDLLFDHFDHHGPNASVRPEGEDDLDLRWIDADGDHRRFVQVKKPIEDAQTRPNPSLWGLMDIVHGLLPDAVAHLRGNEYEQVWVLGDEVTTEVRELVGAGPRVLIEAPQACWTAIHYLARKEAQRSFPAKSDIAKASAKWKSSKTFPTDPLEARRALIEAASTFGLGYGSDGAGFAQCYVQEVKQLYTLLPGILDRICIQDANGSEIEVAERVIQRLEQRYGLQRSIIEHALFRNLRGFISDIAKQPARSFDHEELETELRCVWPQMVPVKEPPPLQDDHVRRPALTSDLANLWYGAAIEVVGISGSGKTRLAAEVLERSRLIHPDRVALYAEVRTGVSLRDCLVGTAFHLRRWGVSKPFAVAIQPDQAYESVLVALAKAFSEMSTECLLLLDLVEGSEPPGFARDLAAFIRAQPSNMLRLIVFGQERGLRELAPLEQVQFGVRNLDTPGLSFEEFVSLVGRRHAEPDRTRLWGLYQQVTAGRAAGLNVSLAQAFARAQTTDEMAVIAARPAEDRLAYAERSRFSRLAARVLSAAERLTCFALPFRRTDAESVFPNENVGLAIHELLDVGLLRRHDSETFEMHETVRAGLEEMIAPQIRRDAHGALATWYRDQGQIGAVILHLERAGRNQEAQTQARDAFLAGKSWGALWPYVARHRLVSAKEVLVVIAGPGRVKGDYLLPDIVEELGDPQVTETLMGLVREQSGRMFADPQWALPIFRAILAEIPSRLTDLIELLIQAAPEAEACAGSLAWLSIAARRQMNFIEPATFPTLDRQPESVQRALLGLLMQGGRAAMQHALSYLMTHPKVLDSGRSNGWPTIRLEIRHAEDVADLLSAIPMASPSGMIRARGPLFGPLGGLIWCARKDLRGPCIAVLQAQAMDSDALVNAIRILLYLGEPTILDLCAPLRNQDGDVGALANLISVMAPALTDWLPYEANVLDQTAEFSVRLQALIHLAWSGRQLDDLLNRLQASDSLGWPRWCGALGLITSLTPFVAAIPLLENALASKDDKEAAQIPFIIARQGQVPGANVTAVLLQALGHRSPQVRLSAALGLARRRDRSALSRLIECYGQESTPELQAILATAVIASGARSTADLAGHMGAPAIDLWWCILAHRTRDMGAAHRLVSIATDPRQLWQVRRAAITAAGRLPYEAALVRIEPTVMAEQSPFTLDHHRSLLAHHVMAHIVPLAAWDLERSYQGNRAGFVSCFASYFEENWSGTLDSTGLPSGEDAAGWLYDMLVCEDGQDCSSVDQLLNSLHVPLLQAAVLRSLRLCGCPERIDVQLGAASHVWLAFRALLERSKFAERGPVLGQRLQALVAGAEWADDRVVKDHLHQLGTSAETNVGERAAAVPALAPKKAGASPLSFQAVVRLLSGSAASALPDEPIVLEPITAEECEILISLADPTKDLERGVTIFTPVVSFTKEGHQVAQRQTTSQGGPSLPDRLRPAIVAANCSGLPIPWHTKQLEGPLGESYAAKFLECLAAQDDAARFYAALAEAEEVLMPVLCQKAYGLSAQLVIDARLIPALARFLHTGGDDFFEGLCILAKCIDAPEIQPILEGLLHRWVQRFDLQAGPPKNDEAFLLWRGFARLNEHPRFGAISDWPQQLETVLRAPMAWYHSQTIVRVLERDPGSYYLVEARLFKETNWEHYREDEIERLDRAAEALFGHIQDTSTL